MDITITGATGFIGSRLLQRLLEAGHQVHVLGRTPKVGLPAGVEFSIWDAMQGEPPEHSLAGVDAVVHLAGEPVSQRWTGDVKRRIRASRVDGTRRLVQALSKISDRPKTFVCSSAIGIYGERGDEPLTEKSAPGSGFLPDVCVEWEKTADLAEALGIRVVKLRTGIVLDPHGGALERMLPPFRLGVGGKLGSGEQWMSWIHLEDMAGLIVFALEKPELRGAVNAAAPNPVRNADFSRDLGKVLRRPALLPVPAMAIRLAFGEMSQIVLASQKVLPAAATGSGYPFRFPELVPALRNLLS